MSLDQQKAAALAYIAALNAWDFDRVKNLLSDDPEFKYNFRPATLKGLGAPSGYDKAGTIAFMHKLHDDVIKEFNFGEPHQLVQSQDKTVVWISANGTAHDNSAYTNEYIMIISFEPGTDKMLNVVEMMDSLFITELVANVAHLGRSGKKG